MRSLRGVFPLAAAVLAATLLSTAPLPAQDGGTIQGVVREAGSNRPLGTVQVFTAATGRGTLTNSAGRFLLVNVPAGQVRVEARGVGYSPASQTVDVVAGQTATVDFVLQQSAIALDEVVVTGAGVATERRKLGNTVATINAAETIESAPVQNVSEVLQGREPGVVGLPSGGLAGEGTRIRIRGSSSLSQSNEPIVYVDGVRVDNYGGFGRGVGAGGGGTPSRLDDINPAAIERIEILKGAAAATLYGTEASNGVIQIFTKKGQSGAPRWSFQVEQALSEYPEDAYPPLAGFARNQEQADRLSAHFGIPVRPFEVFEVQTFPALYETGHGQTYSLSVNGGTPDVTYFVSGRWASEDGPFGGKIPYGERAGQRWGPVQDSDEKRQANANLTILPLDNLRLTVNSMYTESDHEAPDNNNNIYGTISSMINSKPETAVASNVTGTGSFTTVREAHYQQTSQDVQRFAGSFGASYTPLETVSVDLTAGIDMVNQQAIDFQPFGWNVDGVSGNNVRGRRVVSDRNFRVITLDGKASWNEDVSSDFSSAFVVGSQIFFTRTKSAFGTGQAFPGPGVEVAGAGATQQTFEEFLEQVNAGVFAQEQVGWRDFAFLTLGARYDKHSAFGEAAGGAFYPKVSISIVPTDMPGWRENSLLSSMRVRAAVGKSGLQPGAFDKFTTFEALAAEVGGVAQPGLAPLNLGNDELKPEVSTEWEAGAEFGFLDNRLGLDVTYWNRQVDDVLVSRQFAPTGGFRRTQLDNIGQMKAQGVEINLEGVVVSRPNLSLDLFANASYLWEQITDMGDAPPLKVGGSYPRYRNWLREGYAPGAFFGPVLMNTEYPISVGGNCTPASREQLLSYFAQPRSPDAITVLTEACGTPDALLQYIGKPTPDWSGALGGSLTLLRNFEIGTLFEYRMGNFFIHDLSGAFRRSHPLIGRNIKLAAETEAVLINPNSTAEQRLEAGLVWARELKALTPVDGLNEIHVADFVRWRELSLTYNVPTALAGRVGADHLAITLAGRNLGLLTDYPGPDPEMNQIGRQTEVTSAQDAIDNNFLEGVNSWGLPLPRRVQLSVRVGF